MMKNDEKKDKIQQEALSAWLKNNKKGTCEIITGLGKTFISLHALYTMPKNKDIHLFLAETTTRELDLLEDIKKYNLIFKRDVFRDYNLKFKCYQSIYKLENKNIGLIIADEIHDSLSPAYSKFYFNNNYKAIIGLSATIIKNTSYEVDGRIITKGDYLNKIAPICYIYNINQGQKEGTSRKLNVYIINHKLDDVNKNIEAGSKEKRFYQTEKAAYDYWNKEHKKAWFIEDNELKQLKIRITAAKRSKILYNLKSKIKEIKKLTKFLENKSILFGNSINSLLNITPNVISSKNNKKENDRIRNDFENNKINLIGSFKKLKQGANLNNLDNCIIMSYYSTSKDLIQRAGRLRNNGKIGNLFIFVTSNTQEEIWFSKMFETITDYNMIYCPNVEFTIEKLKNENM